ncbi:MAG TPA: NAD(P)/FAD-dependent oxidoreductase [Solirubrobacteraceae bacterium]
MSKGYDAIVVGARCAGSPTAMLLARLGYEVLLVDRATFPSDTMSTHLIHARGVAALKRWGLLDQLRATGCPPITTYSYDFGPLTISGSPRAADGVADAFCPRRIVLDDLLVRAAVAAGAEFREAFTVQEILVEDGEVTGIRGHAKGGATVTDRARVVIGADGKHSLVAKAVGAEQYNEVPTLEVGYYAYWSGLPTEGGEFYLRGEARRVWGVLATHEGLTCVVVGWPRSQFEVNRTDYEAHYMNTFELAPEFAERVCAATRETRFTGTADLPNFFRRPYGPGWALAGDAGYHKDPVTALGISDAFRDAEAVSAALDDTFAGRRSYDDAMAACQQARDAASLPPYGLTCEFAKIEPPPAHMQQLFASVAASRAASDDFASVMAGTLPIPEFFAPDNAERIMREAGHAAPS